MPKVKLLGLGNDDGIDCDAILDMSISKTFIPSINIQELRKEPLPFILGRPVKVIQNGRMETHQTYRITVRIEKSLDVLLTDNTIAYIGRDFLK